MRGPEVQPGGAPKTILRTQRAQQETKQRKYPAPIPGGDTKRQRTWATEALLVRGEFS